MNLRGAAAEVDTVAAFSGPNGRNPYAGLTLASDGNFYGNTYRGGTNGLPLGFGTIFKLTPTGSLTVIHSFSSNNGAKPYAGLTPGLDGHLYGTTTEGGVSNSGTFFRVTTNGILTTLLAFTNGNGAVPTGRLMRASDGSLYGTTRLGGAGNEGTVFRVTTNGLLTTLVSFHNTNGANPSAEVIQGLDGRLYGTTVNGGSMDSGTVFQLSSNGTLTTLVSFGVTNGANPYGGLIQEPDGCFYGTTVNGGGGGVGTVFRMTTNGALFTLHNFSGSDDGANPYSSLLRGNEGILYGTTTLGGAPTVSGAWGTVYQITTNGWFASLLSFNFDNNGASPYGALVQDASGDFYGTTFSQGVGLRGTIFRLSRGLPRLESASSSANSIKISWDAWLGQTYQVQYQTNLTQSGWSDLGNAFSATNGALSVTDPILPNQSRYYRVRQFLTH